MVKKVGKGKQREVKRSREGAGSLYIRMEAAATIGTRGSRTSRKRPPRQTTTKGEGRGVLERHRRRTSQKRPPRRKTTNGRRGREALGQRPPQQTTTNDYETHELRQTKTTFFSFFLGGVSTVYYLTNIGMPEGVTREVCDELELRSSIMIEVRNRCGTDSASTHITYAAPTAPLRPCDGTARTLQRRHHDRATTPLRPCDGTARTLRRRHHDRATTPLRPCDGTAQTLRRRHHDRATSARIVRRLAIRRRHGSLEWRSRDEPDQRTMYIRRNPITV